MPAPFPIQTSFAAGVVSPRLRGRVESKPYREGLAVCDNFIPTPQGSILKREGVDIVSAPTNTATPFIRSLEFKSATLERYQVVLSDQRLEVFTPAGIFAAFSAELVVNGECNAGAGGWTLGAVILQGMAPDQWISFFGPGQVYQTIALSAGTYVLSYRVRMIQPRDHESIVVNVGTALHGSTILRAEHVAEGVYQAVFTLGAGATIYLEFEGTGTLPVFGFDDVSLRDTATATYVAAPWLASEIPDVQYVCETGRERMLLVHPKYEPRVLTRAASGIWALQTISSLGWTSPDASWTGSNWPSVVEVWQGRLWLAATPAKKNTFWASKPFAYDFTIGNGAGDAFSYDVAVKGEIRWLQGQKVMLCGADEGEYSISANDGVVYAGNIDIRQESAFGSAKLQALAIGDQVLFVSPDRRKMRALSFSLEGGGWYARDITFTAEHITQPLIVDMAFARDPYNTIVLCLSDGTLACCNYDRIEQLAGWWTAGFRGATFLSVSVASRPEGHEVWGIASIAEENCVVRWKLYGTETPGLDCSVEVVAQALSVPGHGMALSFARTLLTCDYDIFGVFADHALYIGLRIRFLTAGVVVRITEVTAHNLATVVVVSGDPAGAVSNTTDWDCPFALVTPKRSSSWSLPYVLYPPISAVRVSDGVVLSNLATDGYAIVDSRMTYGDYILGLPFTATAETLPLEGGNPAGSAQGMNVHRADITVRLNDSALPLINGAIPVPPDTMSLVETDPAVALRALGNRYTDDATAKPQSRSPGGIVTITQELPLRTEICALFGNVQMSKV
jgi:hypothetical protein